MLLVGSERPREMRHMFGGDANSRVWNITEESTPQSSQSWRRKRELCRHCIVQSAVDA